MSKKVEENYERKRSKENFGISEKDVTLVKLLISNPKVPLENLAKSLGVTKQALAKRKRKLEENEIIKSYLFWNVLLRFELTKYLLFKVKLL